MKGKGSKIRWTILPDGSKDRPAVGNMSLITGVQTSEFKGGQDFNTTDASGDYESVDGAAPEWQDNDSIKSMNWGFTFSIRKKDNPTNVAQLKALYAAWKAGKQIWIERLAVGDTDWKGGRGFLIDPSEPVPWDGEVTISAGVRGQGATVETPAAAG